MSMKHKSIVLVTWLDAWSSGSTYDPDGDHTGLLSKSVGFEMEYTDVSIVLATLIAEGCEDRDVRVMIIPTEYIVKVEELVL